MTAPSVRQSTLAGLTTKTTAEVRKAFLAMNLADPAGLATPLALLLEEIADKYGAVAAMLAAEWYEEARDAAGAPGSFTPLAAPLPDSTRFEALARWGVGPLFGAAPDAASALSRISGGMTRTVLGQARQTTIGAIAADPVRPTYARHASANACAFCAMLATRGAVYTSETSALRVTGQSLGGTDYRKMRRMGASRDSILAGSRASTVARGGRKGRDTTQALGDKYHDDCHCTVVEVFPGQRYQEAPYVAAWRDAYKNSVVTSGEHGAIDVKATVAEMRQALGSH